MRRVARPAMNGDSNPRNFGAVVCFGEPMRVRCGRGPKPRRRCRDRMQLRNRTCMSSYPVVTLSPRDYDAVLFDLDGVLAKTGSLQACAWKQLFGDFLKDHDARAGKPSAPFDIDADYARYMEGKSR